MKDIGTQIRSKTQNQLNLYWNENENYTTINLKWTKRIKTEREITIEIASKIKKF